MNPESPYGIFVTVSVKYYCRLIAQNWMMKDEEKIKMIKLNTLKRATHINQRGNSFAKLARQPPNSQMTWCILRTPPPPSSKYYSTSQLKSLRDSYHNLGWKMGQFPDQNKWTVVAAIVRKWGEMIWMLGGGVCISWKLRVLWRSKLLHDRSCNYL